jgi:hypothetical protein
MSARVYYPKWLVMNAPHVLGASEKKRGRVCWEARPIAAPPPPQTPQHDLSTSPPERAEPHTADARPKSGDYSALSVSTGSIAAARRAGI